MWYDKSVFGKLVSLVILIISLFLIAFVGYKAFNISFTHDESYTYLHYVHQSFIDIISYKNPFTNNHILNSALMKYSELTFGSSEFSLRLPNVLSLIIYLAFTFLLLRKLNILLVLPVFILMTFNPYLLDFFALARGYGLSIGLMIMSMYFLIRHFGSKQNKDLILFNAAALLSVFANFTLLNYYLAGLITFNILRLIEFRIINRDTAESYKFFKLNKVNIIFIFISAIVLYEPLRRLLKSEMLNFGGKNGFIADTLFSIVSSAFYESTATLWIREVLAYFFVFLVFLILIIVIVQLVKRNEKFFNQNYQLVIVNSILVIISVETIFQHYLFGNDYFVGRFALFLFPLIVLNFGFLMHFILSKKSRVVISLLSILIVTIMTYHLLSGINTKYTLDWKYDEGTKGMIEHLSTVANNSSPTNEKVQLGINWLFEPSVNFCRAIWNLHWLKPVNREGLKENDDYYYIFKHEKQPQQEVIFSSGPGNTVLVKNE